MPFITITKGITIKVPTRSTLNWDETMRTDTFEKISEHDHTGSGKGLQLGAGAFADDAIPGTKIRLNNEQSLRGRNVGNSADINLIKASLNDRVEIGAHREAGLEINLLNNQASAIDLTGLLVSDSDTTHARIIYSLLVDADTDLRESGSLEVIWDGSAWNLQQERIGDDAQIDFTITAAGQMQYTSANYTGFVDAKMRYELLATEA